MKIVHIVKALIVNSGVSVFVGEVAREQAAKNHSVEVFCLWYPDYPTGSAKCEVKRNFIIIIKNKGRRSMLT